ncbi:S4 domain-containing protein [Novacetimonas pomaceti]|uniref:S4 domain-containing protein n=1 Tax=Novacetimonas pomaceti TaxID=2021998 RepID=UPI001C2DC584|nr:S4 domain-containing protein [Novacetimonas pomaceti]MBV1833053.1 hypothetical protein [Novacetimonas pomaceti]
MKLVSLKDAMHRIGLASTRDDARRLISAGSVKVDGYAPGHAVLVGIGVQITVKRVGTGVVSRAVMDASI